MFVLGPALSFYEGSLLSIEWTNQHGCGVNAKLWCNLVLQYMCSYSNADPMVRIRDGTTTNTITNDPTGPTTLDANGDLLYGMHESYATYQACNTRQRNMVRFAKEFRIVRDEKTANYWPSFHRERYEILFLFFLTSLGSLGF